jgi:L-ascorbate metabolism protein UlaG (beta-lactamase superfamily)
MLRSGAMDDRARALGLRRERSRGSKQFEAGLFRNTTPIKLGPKPGTRLDVMRRFWFGNEVRRPPRALPAENPLRGWTRPVDTGLRVTWLGHSTCLLELGDLRILTDPVWSDRISPFGPMAPRRFQPVPIRVRDLPPIDAIVVSHDHFDHLDYGTVRALAEIDAPYVTPLGVGNYLDAWGVPPHRIVELDWWEATTIRGARITATPAQHYSGRVGKRNWTLWSSMVIENDRHRVFFSGDTALTPDLADIQARFGSFDLTMLEIGGFHTAWDHIHLGPANALVAHRMLGGGRLMPVHWGTFNLALHAWDDPAEQLLPLATSQGVELLMPRLGVPFEPTRGLALEPWWRVAGEVPVPAEAPFATAP